VAEKYCSTEGFDLSNVFRRFGNSFLVFSKHFSFIRKHFLSKEIMGKHNNNDQALIQINKV
jgi:hypothetical protein